MNLHAFVAMPFGIKDDINFDRIYADLIKPALEAAGLEAFRADGEMQAGEIRKDMFQELLLADLVVVDASIDNPNVWYELGVRHALRERDVVVIACRDGRLPFDIATDRVLRYHRKDGVPDPATLEADIKLLTQYVTNTMRARSDDSYRSSPVYAVMPSLQEPDWRSLAVKGATGFWSVYDAWRDRVEVARRGGHAGDILVLAEETPTWVLRSEAQCMAGGALMKLNQNKLALEQYQKAFALDVKDRASQQKIGILLGRLGRHAEAREWVNNVIEKYPDDAEGHALMGRIEKEEWIARWRIPNSSPQNFIQQAKTEDALLDGAIEPYTKAFLIDPSHFYSGINALTLRHVLRHLGCTAETGVDIDTLAGGVAWACRSALLNAPKDYWARVTQADLRLLYDEQEKVVKAYRNAIAVADGDWFVLDSSRQQLCILRDLGFRAEAVAAAIAVFDQELARLTPPWQPKHVFLFSGHMIDKPDRAEARFPPAMEPFVKDAIAQKLDELAISADDLAITSAACGGDLLFVEACLARGIHVEMRIPFDEPTFVQNSVAFAGQAWQQRFSAAKNNPLTKLVVMPERLGPLPDKLNAYMRNNRWMVYAALAYGPEKVRFVSLWDGKKGDGAGGTEDMVSTVRKYSGEAHILDAAEILNKIKEIS
jgi:tetratricopeptide (TPR) repeat protein